jgi:CHASE3 domain sensor protein
MTETYDIRWEEFETLGETEVRKRLGAHMFGEDKERLAHQWIEYRRSMESSEARRRTLALATEANDLARSANVAASDSVTIARSAADSASRSAAAARNNNIIATLALIAAAISIALSIISLFLKAH